MEFICKTLYNISIKKNKIEPVERSLKIPYDQFWITFGVPIPTNPLARKELGAVDRSQVLLLAWHMLQTMFLHMPTMEFNKGDQEDSDYEETVEVAPRKVECVTY